MKGKQPDTSQKKRKILHAKVRLWWVIGWIVALTVLLIFYWPDLQKVLSAETSTPPPEATAEKIENAGQDRLLGRWVRTDADYIIEIQHASDDGKLDAAYFNPNPIHIGKAGWNLKDSTLIIELELRDVNYPGSLYTLQFTNDRLTGNYYQAVQGLNFDVEFTREKK